MVINVHFLEESSLLVSISQSQCTKNPAYIDLAREVGKNKILTAPPNGNKNNMYNTCFVHVIKIYIF